MAIPFYCNRCFTSKEQKGWIIIPYFNVRICAKCNDVTDDHWGKLKQWLFENVFVVFWRGKVKIGG